jgi:hypothetical protein
MDTEFSGIRWHIDAISVNNSFVALSEFVGMMYVPSSTAFEAGVLAVYQKSWNSAPLNMGASPARVYRFS